jgi:hypothetical protein
MPRIRKDEAPLVIDEPEITGRYAELDDYTVSFEAFHTETDPARLFAGLPDDRCQCAHFGVVVSGKLEMRYRDHTEIYSEGDAYYAPPGHVPWPHAGSEVVEFTLTDALRATMTVVGANMAQQGASS